MKTPARERLCDYCKRTLLASDHVAVVKVKTRTERSKMIHTRCVQGFIYRHEVKRLAQWVSCPTLNAAVDWLKKNS